MYNTTFNGSEAARHRSSGAYVCNRFRHWRVVSVALSFELVSESCDLQTNVSSRNNSLIREYIKQSPYSAAFDRMLSDLNVDMTSC